MSIFGLDRPSRHSEDTELLTTVYDNGQLAIIRSILDGADIPYLYKERGSGSSVKIITGFSMFGTDIFVRREDLEAAKALIEASDPEETDDSADGEDGKEE